MQPSRWNHLFPVSINFLMGARCWDVILGDTGSDLIPTQGHIRHKPWFKLEEGVRNLFSKNGKASACFYQSATLKWCSRRKIKHDITLQMSDNVSHNFVLPSSICWISVALVLRWKYGDWGGNADERLPYLQGKSRKITSHTENEKREST